MICVVLPGHAHQVHLGHPGTALLSQIVIELLVGIWKMLCFIFSLKFLSTAHTTLATPLFGLVRPPLFVSSKNLEDVRLEWCNSCIHRSHTQVSVGYSQKYKQGCFVVVF